MNKIVEVLGVPPTALLEKAPKTSKYFDRLPDGTYQVRIYKDSKRVRTYVVVKPHTPVVMETSSLYVGTIPIKDFFVKNGHDLVPVFIMSTNIFFLVQSPLPHNVRKSMHSDLKSFPKFLT